MLDSQSVNSTDIFAVPYQLVREAIAILDKTKLSNAQLAAVYLSQALDIMGRE
jgi:hypothetical protein